jgi:hypothetical protein
MTYKEKIDYELIPDTDDQHWLIRVLRGDYIETILRFGKIRIDDTTASKDPKLQFEYTIMSSPIDELKEGGDLDIVAGDILVSIIEQAIINDEALIEDVK